jgi:hypothetical protein
MIPVGGQTDANIRAEVKGLTGVLGIRVGFDW